MMALRSKLESLPRLVVGQGRPSIVSGSVFPMVFHSKADFHFFPRRGGKIFGGVQVICNEPFLMLWEEHEMAN